MLKALFIALISICLLGCKKDPNSPNNYFSFQILGHTYSADSVSLIKTGSNQYTFNNFINGIPGNYPIINNVKLSAIAFISNSSDTSNLNYIGTYYDPDTLHQTNQRNIRLVITITKQIDPVILVQYLSYSNPSSNLFSFSISEWNKTYVAGTFSGYMSSSTMISNGRFKIPITN